MSGGEPRIVVVEDDASMSKAIERLLRIAGFTTTTFASAEDALRADAASTADCLIVDVQLPGMSGFEFYRAVAVSGITLPVLFITAHDAPVFRAEADKLRSSSYFPKPFSGRALVDAVRQSLQSP